MPDPCNLCGACCYCVRGVTEIWRKNGWLNEDGSCKFYDPWFKACTIYEHRPDICRMERTCPPNLTLEQWYDKHEIWCDDAHREVFGCEREKRDENGERETCYHYHDVLEIQVETTAACNARCHFCPYKDPVNDTRRGKLMDADLFYKIVDEVAEIPQIRQFAFNGLGESLSDKRIYDFVAYVHAKCPKMHLLLHTNGVYLTEPRRLRDAGLTKLVVSLNAVNAKQHEKIMGLKDQFDRVCANIEKARALSGWTVTPRAVYSQDRFTEEDVAEFQRRWGADWGTESITSYETNWINQNRTQMLPVDESQGCRRALTQIYIAYDGSLHMCCMDAFGRIKFGNVRDNTIREIYNSEKYLNFRLAHAEDRATDVPECMGCSRC